MVAAEQINNLFGDRMEKYEVQSLNFQANTMAVKQLFLFASSCGYTVTRLVLISS